MKKEKKQKNSPKGKKKLEFGEKSHSKGKNPLQHKAIYLDLKDKKKLRQLAEDLKNLGANIEEFLSKDINYVITCQPIRRDGQAKDDLCSPDSPSVVSTPSPFNCGPSPSNGDIIKPNCTVTRGRAMVQQAKMAAKGSNILENAKKWGAKIISLDAAIKWVQKELPKCQKKTQAGNGKFEPKIKSGGKMCRLKQPYIKFESPSLHYKPVHQELDSWPHINPDTPRGTCPFDGSTVGPGLKSQEERGDCGEGIKRPSVGKLSPATADKLSVGASVNQEPSVSRSTQGKNLKQSENTLLSGSHLIIAGDIERRKQKKRLQERRKGYCECCQVKYADLNLHVMEDHHKNYVRDRRNYQLLDKLISAGHSTANFLQQILMHHCQEKNRKKDRPSTPRKSSGVTDTYIVPTNKYNRAAKALPKKSLEKPVTVDLPRAVEFNCKVESRLSCKENLEGVEDIKVEKNVEKSTRRDERNSVTNEKVEHFNFECSAIDDKQLSRKKIPSGSSKNKSNCGNVNATLFSCKLPPEHNHETPRLDDNHITSSRLPEPEIKRKVRSRDHRLQMSPKCLPVSPESQVRERCDNHDASNNVQDKKLIQMKAKDEKIIFAKNISSEYEISSVKVIVTKPCVNSESVCRSTRLRDKNENVLSWNENEFDHASQMENTSNTLKSVHRTTRLKHERVLSQTEDEHDHTSQLENTSNRSKKCLQNNEMYKTTPVQNTFHDKRKGKLENLQSSEQKKREINEECIPNLKTMLRENEKLSVTDSEMETASTVKNHMFQDDQSIIVTKKSTVTDTSNKISSSVLSSEFEHFYFDESGKLIVTQTVGERVKKRERKSVVPFGTSPNETSRGRNGFGTPKKAKNITASGFPSKLVVTPKKTENSQKTESVIENGGEILSQNVLECSQSEKDCRHIKLHRLPSKQIEHSRETVAVGEFGRKSSRKCKEDAIVKIAKVSTLLESPHKTAKSKKLDFTGADNSSDTQDLYTFSASPPPTKHPQRYSEGRFPARPRLLHYSSEASGRHVGSQNISSDTDCKFGIDHRFRNRNSKVCSSTDSSNESPSLKNQRTPTKCHKLKQVASTDISRVGVDLEHADQVCQSHSPVFKSLRTARSSSVINTIEKCQKQKTTIKTSQMQTHVLNSASKDEVLNNRVETPSEHIPGTPTSGYSRTPRRERWKKRSPRTDKTVEANSRKKSLERLKFPIEPNLKTENKESIEKKIELKTKDDQRVVVASYFSKEKQFDSICKQAVENGDRKKRLVGSGERKKLSFDMDCKTPELTKRTVKLNHSWPVLSSRSVIKLLASENDDEPFEGFNPMDISGKTDLPTDISFVEVSEVDVGESEHEWHIDQDTSDQEESDCNVAQIFPDFSSPGKTSVSSWGNACEEYIHTSINQKLRPDSGIPDMDIFLPHSPKNSKRGRKERAHISALHNVALSPNKRKRSKAETVSEYASKKRRKIGIEVVDNDIEFNHRSPQKFKLDFSPLRVVNNEIILRTADQTSTPIVSIKTKQNLEETVVNNQYEEIRKKPHKTRIEEKVNKKLSNVTKTSDIEYKKRTLKSPGRKSKIISSRAVSHVVSPRRGGHS
ncbi:hypothetical protein ScPMuIL_016282 [Solemya velum]